MANFSPWLKTRSTRASSHVTPRGQYLQTGRISQAPISEEDPSTYFPIKKDILEENVAKGLGIEGEKFGAAGSNDNIKRRFK